MLPAVACSMAVEFNFTPELRLIDGRIIRNLDDATLFAREHEARPASTGGTRFCTRSSVPGTRKRRTPRRTSSCDGWKSWS